MSSSSHHPALVLVVLSLAAFAIGCGRSPAMPRTPVKMVRVEEGRAVLCNCAVDDDDDDDELTPRKSPPVEYVRLSEWQEPESARRAAADVAPRGNEDGPRYIEFPKLTRYKPIDEPRAYGRRGR